MSGRRLRKVDYAGGLTAGDVAVVVALLFGHVDGEERAVGILGVGDASVLTTPRSCMGCLARRRRAA
jgi:hypothetical protein